MTVRKYRRHRLSPGQRIKDLDVAYNQSDHPHRSLPNCSTHSSPFSHPHHIPPPMPSLTPLDVAWQHLSTREYIRQDLSKACLRSLRPAPEQLFYSTKASLKYRTSNRYSNILAFDRTAVDVGGRYLNANVICARGGWWVGAQVRLRRDYECVKSGGIALRLPWDGHASSWVVPKDQSYPIHPDSDTRESHAQLVNVPPSHR
jgi:hypothetical protein